MASGQDTTVRREAVASPQPPEVPPYAGGTFWRNVVRLEADKIAPWLALRNTLGFALPLAVGIALGSAASGLVMSTGALNVSFSDSHEPYAVRARRMLAASLLVGFAVIAGALSGRNTVTAVAVAGAWALAAGILVALSTAAADLGVVSLVTLVVFAAVPMAPRYALLAGLLALAGGLLQTMLSLALWPLRRYAPESRALGDLYLELSRAAASRIEATQAPPATAQITQALNSLATLNRDHSVQAERLRLLLSQAERMRLSLLVLARLRTRLQRETPDGREVEILERYFETAARMLGLIGNSLHSGHPAGEAAEYLYQLQVLAEELRREDPAARSAVSAMVGDARFQMDALAGQLRSALDLAAYATPSGAAAHARRETRTPWSLRLQGTLATLRANLTLESAACRHALRLAVCIAIGDALARGLDLRRSYWLPMTIAIVLKPDFAATFSRGVLRLAGTFVGLVFATALFHVLPAAPFAEVAAIAVMMFVLRCLGPANYGILVTAVTGLVVLMLAVTGVAPKEVIAARGLNTVAGGAIALLAYWLWPTWERTRISATVAQMLDAYRLYFRAIRESYIKPDTDFRHELDHTRVSARLARSNLEASFDRLSAEPGSSSDSVRLLSGILASSHRLVHALMALEAGLSSSHPVPARQAFRPFANHVELTLYYLAAALRGSPLTPDALPDLREDHHALVHSGDSLTERYALVNVETDRITNSLNTLSEQLVLWSGLDEGTKAAG